MTGHHDGWHWFTTARLTVAVYVNHGRIAHAPPIARKFVGEPLGNLERWLARMPGFRHVRLTEGETPHEEDHPDPRRPDRAAPTGRR